MPVFNGFDGEKFHFGCPNKFYNLLTDNNIQINAHFDSKKNMNLIGIKLGHPSTYVKWAVKDEQAEINNKKLYNCIYFNIGCKNNIAYATMKFQFESDPACILAKHYTSCLFVDAVNYSFYICKFKDHFDINISIHNRNSRPHGIIGQTADFNGAPRISFGKHGEGIIEGKLSDYEINNLWTNNFKYNRFKESA